MSYRAGVICGIFLFVGFSLYARDNAHSVENGDVGAVVTEELEEGDSLFPEAAGGGEVGLARRERDEALSNMSPEEAPESDASAGGYGTSRESSRENSVSSAPEGEEQLPIVADADSVEYDREKDTITGTGNAVVRYKGATLTADKIVVYLENGDTYAEGRVNLYREGEFLTGKRLRYNFRTGEGNITECHAHVQPWYAYGETARRISEEELRIDDGYLTTCDYPDPHTSLRARRIYIYPGDSIIAHNVTMYLYDTPVFWVPYVKYSLINHESPYNFVPGFSSDWGFFLLSAIDLYKTEHIRITPHLDIRHKRGLGTGVTVDYDLESAPARGELDFYFTGDQDPDWNLNYETDKSDRYRVTLDHEHELADDTMLTLKLNKQSDEDFIDDFFRGEFEDEIQRENYLDITKVAEKYQLTLFAEPRLNDFYTVVQRLPEFRVEAVNQRIGETPFFYESRSALTNFDYRFSEDPLTEVEADLGIPEPPVPDPIKSVRFDTYHELSYPKKYFKWLMLRPWVGFCETYYSKAPTDDPKNVGTGIFYDSDGGGEPDREYTLRVWDEEEKNVWRGLFTLGFESSVKFWRVWDYYNKKLKINRLRHVFEPVLTYNYFSTPSREYPREVYGFDEYDFFNESSMITLELRNALQTQRGEGENVDLFDISIYLDMMTSNSKYDGWQYRAFVDEHYSIAERREGFKKLFNDAFLDAEFRPLDWQKLDFEAYYNFDEARFDEFNTDYYIYRNDVVSFALGQRYLVHDSNLWTTEFNLQLNDDWAARTYLRFEADDGTFEEGEWSLFRDLHEWEAALTVRYRGRRKSSVGFFLLFYLDAYPDVPVEVRF